MKYGRCGDGSDSLFENQGSASGYNNCDSRNRHAESMRAENVRVDGRGNAARESGLKGGVEEDQAQDLDLELDLKWDGKRDLKQGHAGAEVMTRSEENEIQGRDLCNSQAGSPENSTANANSNAVVMANSKANSNANSNALTELNANSSAHSDLGAEICGELPEANAISNSGSNQNAGLRLNATGNERQNAAGYAMSAREIVLQRELRVGAGPVCGPARIRPEVLERIRLREEERARVATRSP